MVSPIKSTRSQLWQGSNLVLGDDTNKAMLNYDGTEMRDGRGQIVYRSQFLSTHPLRSDCKERVGYGGKKFSYVSGDGVIRTMNAIFGHGGWSSQVMTERLVQSEKDERGRWNIGYLAFVKVSLLNGVSHEDCGSGEGINESKIKAHEKAIKSAVTDAMKRAARHFGERLGNALYVKGNGIKTAPKTNKDALEELERSDALNLFGNQAAIRDKFKEEEQPPKTKSSAIDDTGNVNELVMNEELTRNQVQHHTSMTPVASADILLSHRAYLDVVTLPPFPTTKLSGSVPLISTAFQGETHLETNHALNIPMQQNKNTNLPPRSVFTEARGISPENTVSIPIINDYQPSDNKIREINSVLEENDHYNNESNKRLKRNPYNRLSC